jgi:uncharacterized protein YbjQ (UPF0145 family)
MKSSAFLGMALVCALCTAGCATPASDAAKVKVFDATQLTQDRYDVVTRIWTQSWRSAFWVPTHDEAADAVAALTSKAADAGADGVVNLHCLNDTGWFGGYFCYGLAIKLK